LSTTKCGDEKKEKKCLDLLGGITAGNRQALKTWQSKVKPKDCCHCNITVSIAQTAGANGMTINRY